MEQSVSTQQTSVHFFDAGSQNAVTQSKPSMHVDPTAPEPGGFSSVCRQRPRYSGAPAVCRYELVPKPVVGGCVARHAVLPHACGLHSPMFGLLSLAMQTPLTQSDEPKH